ncbi:MAG: hypothetical protein ACXWZ2_15970 [Mycobacterium sp.]
MTMAHAAVRVTDDQTGFGRDAIVTISIGAAGSNWVRSAFDKGWVIRPNDGHTAMSWRRVGGRPSYSKRITHCNWLMT